MKITKLFKTIYKISRKLGNEAYVVGGYVRDEMHGIEQNKDIDFVVVGSGLEFAKAFAEEIGEEHGSLIEFPDFDTARFVFTEEDEEGNKKVLQEIEFAGARKEDYKKESRKPHVEPATLEEDLSRRDFTVNAMARRVMSAGKLGKVVDPYGGEKDLEKKILRTPLEPDETFSEDPLRMLRAARFAAQLEFEIEEKTLNSIEKNRERLRIISAERIQEELFKLLAAPKPSVGLWILFNTKLLDEFLPEISALHGVEDVYGKSHKENLSHTFKVVDNLSERTNKVLLRYAGLMHDVGKPGTKKYAKGRGWTFDMHEHLGRKIVRQIGKRLRMSKSDTEYVANLVRWHQQPIALMDEGVTDSPVRRLIVNLKDDLGDLLNLCKSDITTGNPNRLKKRLKNYDYLEEKIEEVMEKDKLRAFQSPFRGEEIMEACGLKPGPTVGKIKTAIEDAILDGVIPNEYDDAKEYFEKIKDEYLEGAEEWELLK